MRQPSLQRDEQGKGGTDAAGLVLKKLEKIRVYFLGSKKKKEKM